MTSVCSGGQSCGNEPLTHWIWFSLQIDSIRIGLHSQTPCGETLFPETRFREALFTPLSVGTSPAGQWLRYLASTEGGLGSVHGWGAWIPRAMWWDQKNWKKKFSWSFVLYHFDSTLSFFVTSLVYFKTLFLVVYLGFPWWLRQYRIHLQCGRPGLDSWVKIPWRRAWQPTPVFLPGKSQGRGSLGGYSA